MTVRPLDALLDPGGIVTLPVSPRLAGDEAGPAAQHRHAVASARDADAATTTARWRSLRARSRTRARSFMAWYGW
ncbi:hypothetical protein [Mycetohabitans sp. B46]|uniref:hypothetical protein n=1 Tax=Mycetohabitans sp. B46 TaxID=2772536 RepID=UPI00307F7E81